MPKKTSFFAICISILSIAFCFAVADLFSSIITIGDFAFLQVQAVKTTSYKIYALSLESFSSESATHEKVNYTKQRGGAGYVYNVNNTFYVLASAYENENDCQKVKESLSQESSTQIVTIQIEQIVMDSNFSNEEKLTLTDALNSFKTVYKIIYDLSVSLDTNVKSLPDCRLEVYNLKTIIQEIQQNFTTAFNPKLTNELMEVKLKLSNLLNIIQVLIDNDESEKVEYSSLLKLTYIQSVVTNKQLADSLSEK